MLCKVYLSSLFCTPPHACAHALPTTVHRAVNLIASDPNGKSDPYCVIHLGSPGEQLYKTEVKNATLAPVWDEEFVVQSKHLSPYVFTAGKLVNIWPCKQSNSKCCLNNVLRLILDAFFFTLCEYVWYAILKHFTFSRGLFNTVVCLVTGAL